MIFLSVLVALWIGFALGVVFGAWWANRRLDFCRTCERVVRVIEV